MYTSYWGNALKRNPSNMDTMLASRARHEGLLHDRSATNRSEITLVEVQTAGSFPLSDRFAHRDELVSALSTNLNSKGLLILKGSTGMGKSTLARLLVERDGATWRFLNFRQLSPEEIRNTLLGATLADRAQDVEYDYVIDDLNFDQSPTSYGRQLEGFLSIVILRGGRVIITTQGEFPSRITHALDLPATCLFSVPSFSEEEIAHIACKHGCSEDKWLESWKRIIHTNSVGGHPLLAHAMIRKLEARGWPKPRLEDLLSPQGVDEIKREARKSLQDLLPSDGSRKLLYRLSIFTTPFKRIHALKIASHPLAVENPGESFDLMLGPWVEQLQQGYHQLSPLLYNSANEVFTPDEIKSLHRSAARAYLAEKVITISEFRGAFFHGFLGEAIDVLTTLYGYFLICGKEIRAQIGLALEWLTYLQSGSPTRMFQGDSLLSIQLRHVQFMVAIENAKYDQARQIAEFWEWEFEQLDSEQMPEGFSTACYLLFYSHLLYDIRFPLRPSELVSHSVKKLFLLNAPSPPAAIKQLVADYSSSFDDANFVVMNAILRYHKAEEVEEFFVSLHNQDSQFAGQIWSQLQNNDYFSEQLLDGLWLNEVDAKTPDWQKCIERVERVATIGLAHKANSVVAEAYRIQAIIYEEYLHNPQKALQALDDGQSQLGGPHITLNEYRAKIFSLEGREADALKLWDTMFPLLESAKSTFSYRSAMITAINLGNWGRAADYACQAEKAAHESGYDKSLVLGLRADHAFALWMAQKSVQALSIFVSIIDELPPPAELKSKAQFWWLYIKVMHAAQWMNQYFEGGTKYFQPPAGWFSDQKIDREMPDELLGSYIYILYFLAQVEYRCSTASEIFGRLEKASQDPQVHPIAKTNILLLRLDRSLKLLQVENLVEEYSEFFECSRQIAKHENLAGPDFLISYILAALFALAVNRGDKQAPISKWRDDAERYNLLSDQLNGVIAFVEYSFSATNAQLLKILKGGNGYLGIAAAIFLSNADDINPNDRFRADAILLFEGSRHLLWREGKDHLIEQHLTKSWLAVIERQSFDLFGSTFSIKQIRQACEDESAKGRRKAARIILAIENAVATPLHPTLRQHFEQMAQ